MTEQMKYLCLSVVTLLLLLPAIDAAEEGKHLFILSGQSNMKHMKPGPFFNAVREEFGNGNIAVVKDDQSGQPISRWYKKWESIRGEKPAPEKTGDLYDRLMKKVNAVARKNKIQTVTFVWMQGESDARKDGEVYADSLKGLMNQLKTDLGRNDLNFVIGRISDHNKVNPEKCLHWDMIRKIKDGIHYTAEGYKKLAERFAEKAIALIKKSAK